MRNKTSPIFYSVELECCFVNDRLPAQLTPDLFLNFNYLLLQGREQQHGGEQSLLGFLIISMQRRRAMGPNKLRMRRCMHKMRGLKGLRYADFDGRRTVELRVNKFSFFFSMTNAAASSSD